MKFVVLDNIKELKEIFTPYILTALKEKYMETYQRRCLDEINKDYKEERTAVRFFAKYRNTISHYSLNSNPSVRNKIGSCWKYDIAEFPKRFIYSSGLNHPNGFKEL